MIFVSPGHLVCHPLSGLRVLHRTRCSYRDILVKNSPGCPAQHIAPGNAEKTKEAVEVWWVREGITRGYEAIRRGSERARARERAPARERESERQRDSESESESERQRESESESESEVKTRRANSEERRRGRGLSLAFRAFRCRGAGARSAARGLDGKLASATAGGKAVRPAGRRAHGACRRVRVVGDGAPQRGGQGGGGRDCDLVAECADCESCGHLWEQSRAR
eukprot:5208607-Pleurochrysis_carterae.AAC.3